MSRTTSGDGPNPDIWLATCAAMADGEEWTGTNHLLPALSRRGVDARWAVWDDPAVDWGSALVAVRSTWDYELRRPQFLDWARSLPRMLNSAAVFAWNTDKTYLPQLAGAGVPVVPTVAVTDPDELAAAVAALPVRAVVKPRVGAGGRGLVVTDQGRGFDPGQDDLGPGPWVVQPLLESVRHHGEVSVFVIDGQVVSQAQKVPAAGEIRVHEQYGGTTVAVDLDPQAADLARRTVEASQELLGERLDYARVDQMRLDDGTLVVSELEATEPGLYLEVLPGNAEAFADLVVARLSG